MTLKAGFNGFPENCDGRFVIPGPMAGRNHGGETLNAARNGATSSSPIPPARGDRLPHREPADTPGHTQDESIIEASSLGGLRHSYIIDMDGERRTLIHRALSGGPNMVVRSYGTREAFLAASETLDEGCVLLFGYDHEEGLAAFIRELRQRQRFACIMLVAGQDMRAAIEAMKAGAADCLLYPCETAEILTSVDDALTLVRRTVEDNSALIGARRQIERLTPRERDVLQGLLHGKSNKMIAIDLHISPRTVEIYRAHLMEKLGTHSLSETLKIAFAAGLN